ncbi:MAG: outer membrane lipoprotein carrier protein LolA [Parvularculaceae bacterium]
MTILGFSAAPAALAALLATANEPVGDAPPPVPDARAQPVDLPAPSAEPSEESSAADGDGAATAIEAEPVAFADMSDADVVAMVAERFESVKTLRADFVQTAPSGAVSTGDFYLRRPGQMRFDYDDPSPLTIVATQGNVYVQDAELEQTDLYPVRTTPLKHLLSKRLDLESADVLSVDRSVDAVAVALAAGDGETEGDITLVFDAETRLLDRWVVRDPRNGLTVVRLDDLRVDEKLSNRLFRAPEAGGRFINN